MSLPSVRGVGRFVGQRPLAAAMAPIGCVDGIAALSMSSMSAMSFVHEHMHEGAQQQDGQWQPAECYSKVGAMLDATIDDGERKDNPDDTTSGTRRGWREGGTTGQAESRG